MNSIQKAINRIKEASLLLIGNRPKNYQEYRKIEPSGTVEQACKDVGKAIQTILDELEGKSN